MGFDTLEAATDAIIVAGQFLAGKGWAPASSGNYSARVNDGRLAVTVSGRDKGDLTRDGVMAVTAAGIATDAAETRLPSAETLLHAGIYQVYPDCGAVLHTHSQATTVFTKKHNALKHLVLTDYEFLKLFPGVTSHLATVTVPIFGNTQDIPALAAEITPVLTPNLRAYLIRGHGLYVWGRDMAETRRLAEAMEFMIGCEAALRA